MNGHSVASASLQDAFAAALARARQQPPPGGWFDVCAPCPQGPLGLLANAAALGAPYVFRLSSDRRRALLGVGQLLRVRRAGPDRLAAVAEAARAARAPWLLGLFSFDAAGSPRPFAPADFIVPQLLVEEQDGRRSVRLIGRVDDPGGAPSLWQALLARHAPPHPAGRVRFVEAPGSRVRWQREVSLAVRAIRAGELEKVVLARSALAVADGAFDAAAVAAALARTEQHATVFAVHRGHRTFVGATPELLVRVEGRQAEVDCLAGSAPRGATAAEDAVLGQALLGSAKNRREHDFVVTGVLAALRAAGATPVADAGPGLLRLPSVQHLLTPVRATLAEGVGPLEIAGFLHPTPAMGGTPPAAAQAWIARHERPPRGLFAGGVGYVRGEEGTFDVAIRCALLDGRRGRLWAGCGIVADSDPAEELRESHLKLRPMRRALREAGTP